MRHGVSGHGAGLSRPRGRSRHDAGAPRPLAQGHDAAKPHRPVGHDGPLRPGAAGRARRSRAPAHPVHPALGPQPLRRAGGGAPQGHRHPRPRPRPPDAQLGRSLARVHRGRARSPAEPGLRAGEGGAPLRHPRPVPGVGGHPRGDGADPGAVARHRTRLDPDAGRLADRHRRGDRERRPRPPARRRPRARPAPPPATGPRRHPHLGDHAHRLEAELPVVRLAVRPPLAAAARLFPEAPCRRRDLPLRLALDSRRGSPPTSSRRRWTGSCRSAC